MAHDREDRNAKRTEDPHARDLERTPSMDRSVSDVEKDVSNRKNPERPQERDHAGPDTMEDVLDLDYERGPEGR